MNERTTGRTPVQLPDIVRTVLTQAEKHRRAGMISQEIYERQLRRITVEELVPLNLSLAVRELADGRTRFLIKETHSGKVCEMVDAPYVEAD